MPSNVAVEGPYARIVGVELKHQIARILGTTAGDNRHVAALRVSGVDNLAIPLTVANSEDVEVVAVEMLRGEKCG